MNLYLKFLAMHLKSQMQYKISFVFLILGRFLLSFTLILGLLFMFSRFHEIEGFSLEQVLLCFAVISMASALAECFGRGFDVFPRLIRTGQLDRLLVRPRHEVFQVLAMEMEFTRFGSVLQAVLVFCYVIPRSGVHWSGDKIVTLVLMIICGSLVFFALYLIYAAFSFFTIEGLEFMNILVDGGREFGRYPFSVYGDEVLKFLTYVVPLALVQYYPLLYLLDLREGPFHMLIPVLSLLFLIPAYAFWRFGLSKYKSTGS